MSLKIENAAQLTDFIKAIVEPDSWSAHAFMATVQSQNSDRSYNVKPDDSNLPQMSSVKFLGGIDVDVTLGDSVLCTFDADTQAWILGRTSKGTATQYVPLGTALITYLNNLVSVFNTHVHAIVTQPVVLTPTPTCSGMTSPTATPQVSATTAILSTTVRVEP